MIPHPDEPGGVLDRVDHRNPASGRVRDIQMATVGTDDDAFGPEGQRNS
jgi:hypothetical protein